MCAIKDHFSSTCCEIFERCREVLKEDAAGSLQASVDDVVYKSKRRRMLDRPVNVRLGMVCERLDSVE